MFRRLPHCIFLLVVSAACAAADLAPDLTNQRQRFPLAWETAQHVPGDAWRKLAEGLESYPLYPYLEFAALKRHIGEVQRAEVDKYLAAWPGTLPAQLLRESFLEELARRGAWKDFVDLYTARGDVEFGVELRCDALQGRLALQQPLDFDRDVQPLWLTAQNLPDACDAAINWAKSKDKLNVALIWQRIDLAARAGHASVVESLATLLDGAERTAAEHLALAMRDPAAAANQANTWPDATHAREAATVALARLARRDSDAAIAKFDALVEHFHFDAEQRGRIQRTIAISRASSFAPDALQRLAVLPTAAADDASREWRVRAAVSVQDWTATLAALDALAPAQAADARWRYLRARTLVKLDRNDEAEKIFADVAHEANFHGFLAADWIKQPYAICPSELPADPDAGDTVRRNPSLVRAFEFFAIDRLADARREWDFALRGFDTRQRRAAAAAATQRGWYDRAVYTLNQGDDQRLYDLRFPLARREQIERDAQAAGIDPSWAYAIIRAESAWTTDAKSGADAWGLMQLLPGTARQLAKVEKVAFPGASALFDPDLNIRLGTRYLGNMADRYDGSPWLASAAYNAGQDPVARWVAARDTLEPDFFIETIPYKETREYVARVLAFSVIYDWRLHGTALPLASRLPRIGQAYAAPGADTPRKTVMCPATAAAAATIAAPIPATTATADSAKR
jgi:soluble lytic murein transglycosylase